MFELAVMCLDLAAQHVLVLQYDIRIIKHCHKSLLIHDGKSWIKKLNNHKNRSRNIIWFNPPYNKWISSNIGWDLLNVISKNFPNNSHRAKIFNKNNIKVSYSCTNNIAKIIKKTQRKKNTKEKKRHLQSNSKNKQLCHTLHRCNGRHHKIKNPQP